MLGLRRSGFDPEWTCAGVPRRNPTLNLICIKACDRGCQTSLRPPNDDDRPGSAASQIVETGNMALNPATYCVNFFGRVLAAGYLIVLFTNSTQSAQRLTSAEKIAADPRKAYFVIRSIMQDDLRVKWPRQECSNVPKKITILCCQGWSTFYVTGPIRRALVNLAFEVLLTRAAMSANGIPSFYWEASLLQYEESTLRALERKNYIIRNRDDVGASNLTYIELKGVAFSDLTEKINAAMQSGKMDLTVREGECGGPPGELEIRTAPPRGIVHLLPRIFYLYCKRQGDDADDRRVCDHWIPPIHTPETVYVGGIYRYWIEWPNKRGSPSEFDADRYLHSPSAPKPVILR